MIAAINFKPASRSPVAASCQHDEKDDESRGHCQCTPPKLPNALILSEGDPKDFGCGQSLREKCEAFRRPGEGGRGGRFAPRMRIDNQEKGRLANIKGYVGSEEWQFARISLQEEKPQHQQLRQNTASPQP